MKIKLLYIVSHPIQYQAPLLRYIGKDPEIDLFVIFEKTFKDQKFFDKGFSVPIQWDVDLTTGYNFCSLDEMDKVNEKVLNADIVWIHGWDSRFKRKTLRFAKRHKIPVLMRGENTQKSMPDGWGIKGLLKRLYLKKIFDNCDGFLCIGSENKDYYLKHGVLKEKLFFMPYTVDNNFFQERAAAASKRRRALRKELNLEPKSPIVLFAGKLQKRKNPDLLISAFIELDHQKLNHPYLIFVGDGAMRSKLETMNKFKDGKIKFMGFKNQSDIPAFYDLADVFVLPSEREPWGLAINEAMNCSTVVIASDQCGAAADILDEKCGYVIPLQKKEALVSALTCCLSDPSANARLGEEARKKIANWGLPESVTGLKDAIKFLVPSQA